MPARVRTTPAFAKAAKRLHRDLQRRAVDALTRFAQDPARPSLNFESVTGHKGLFTIRVSRAVRIVLRADQDDQGTIYSAVNVGGHEVYDRL